jgi:hypothetical protein
VHHPYDDFATSVYRLIEEAADDPAVTAIKLTLYRSGQRSAMIDALVRLLRRERRSRSSSSSRRASTRRRTYTGRDDWRTPAFTSFTGSWASEPREIALIVRREGDTVRRYVHLGTGNYNAATARFYTDVGVFSADDNLDRRRERVVQRAHWFLARAVGTVSAAARRPARHAARAARAHRPRDRACASRAPIGHSGQAQRTVRSGRDLGAVRRVAGRCAHRADRARDLPLASGRARLSRASAS